MTKEEAIRELKQFSGTTRLRLSANFWEALNTAIKALEQEPCEDCVSRKRLMDNYNAVETPVGYRKVVDMEVIKNMPPVTPTTRWIPVSERLPEESLNSVIGWDSYRERCVFVQYIDGYFQITGSDESFDIVAWLPLPECYEAEKENE